MDARKSAILRAVVEQYIESGQPVGSSALSGVPGLDVSPATVRNEMSALERDGYLMQPHTSAGRIPTDQGYRFFVDEIALPHAGTLTSKQQVRVREFFDHAHGELEQMLQATTNLLSNMTQYAAVVVEPSHEEATIRLIQLVPINSTVVLLVVILSNGAVEKHTIEVSIPVTDEDAAVVSSHITRQVNGLSLRSISAIPLLGDSSRDGLIESTTKILSSDDHGEIERAFVGGTSQMISSFNAVDTVRDVVATLEQQFIVVSLLREVLDRGLSVAIGSELGVEPLAQCSVVVAPYSLEGSRQGTIGVLGPTRMDYSQALATVATVSEKLSQRLSEGS